MNRLFRKPGSAALFAGLSSVLGIIALASGRRDFSFFDCALTIWTSGFDVYDLVTYRQCLSGRSASFGVGHGFPYPPTLLGLLVPIGWFPAASRSLVWSLASSLALGATATMLFQHPLFGRTFRTPVTVGILMFCFLPLLMGLSMGHIAPILAAAFFVSLCCAGASSPWLRFVGGLAASCFLVKPHIVWAVSVLGLVDVVRRRDVAAVAGLLTGACYFFAVPILLAPDSFGAFARHDVTDSFLWRTPTIPSIIENWLGVPRGIGTMSAMVIGVIWIGYTIRTGVHADRERMLCSFLQAAAISVLTVPYVWPYDYALLFPGVLILYGRRSLLGFRAPRAAFILAGILYLARYSVGVTPGPIDALVPLVVLISLELSRRNPELCMSERR